MLFAGRRGVPGGGGSEETPVAERDAAAGSGGRRLIAPALFAAAGVAAAAAAVFFTWRRLFLGMDLQDESYYVLVPWRWALGDRPFVNEENLAQISGFLEYPFVKAFAVVRDYDVTGLVLYTRHLYLLLMIAVALVVFLALRRLVRWPLALPVAATYVAFIFWQTPQLSYNTMGAAFLTLGTACGLWVVMGWGGRRWAFASGVSFGLAVVAYPTLLFVVPFAAVFLAFAMGRRAVGMVAQFAFAHPPDPEGPPTGRTAWRALSFWVLGGVVVLAPVGLLLLSFGVRNLQRCWAYTLGVARELHQLGGAAKAVDVAQGFWRLLWSRPYLLVAALLVALVYTRWPRLGRALLVLLPLALWFAGQRPMLNASGFVVVYGFLTVYLYLFIPRERRQEGARLLYWVWAPAVIAGAMTAFTSAAGYVASPVGFLPALMAAGVFLAWALEAVAAPGRPQAAASSETAARRALPAPVGAASWLAMAVLVAVLGVLVTFQFEFQQRDVPYSRLTTRFDAGPWWGINVTPERHERLSAFSADLEAQARPGDQLLVFYQACGYYLFWGGPIAANSYWLSQADPLAPLPQATISYYRRHRVVPTLVVHLIPTTGLSDAQLQATCGGLGYPPTLVRPMYAFQRKPPGETTADVLARLPRADSR